MLDERNEKELLRANGVEHLITSRVFQRWNDKEKKGVTFGITSHTLLIQR